MRSNARSVVSKAVSIVVVGMLAVACGSSDPGGSTTTASAVVTGSSSTAQGCAELSALGDSLSALTQVDLTQDGLTALQSAVADVKSNLEASAAAASGELKPAVDQVQTAFDQLETALQGVSSSTLAASATQIGTALAGLGAAAATLSTTVSQNCPGS